MKILQFFTIAVLSVFLVLSCKEKPTEASKVLYDEVMKIHDDVMPEMGTIHKLKKKLKKRLENEFISEEEKSAALKAITDLEKADDGMMDWMAAFKLPEATNDSVQINYLTKEKVVITQVEKDMWNSINAAKSILK